MKVFAAVNMAVVWLNPEFNELNRILSFFHVEVII